MNGLEAFIVNITSLIFYTVNKFSHGTEARAFVKIKLTSKASSGIWIIPLKY